MSTAPEPRAVAIVEPVDVPISVENALVSFSRAGSVSILESSMQTTGYGRFTVLASDPAEIFTIDDAATSPLDALGRRLSAYPTIQHPAGGPPFVGGWIGFISYEAGLTTECINPTTRSDVRLPLVRFALYDVAAVFDHVRGQWLLVGIDWPQPWASQRPPVSVRLEGLRRRLDDACHHGPEEASPKVAHTGAVPNMSPEAYIARVERAKRYIEAGDIYQVNLTQRFTTRAAESPIELYGRLRQASASSHAAFLSWDKTAILSASPELFLNLKDGHVITRPIKGTRPRGCDPQTDSVLRRELVESEKDRAELNMIIDLLRNDLGRVCSYGSVRVTCADEIEEHPTVFHRVATIEGDLAPNRTWLDLLVAAFPGGSITGAPKIRAMQIIDELEPTHRGVYCGSLGWIGLDGSMSLNIAIRTMVQVDEVVHAYAGGAIVADSVAEEEYDEILAKAAGMFMALRCEGHVALPDIAEVTVF